MTKEYTAGEEIKEGRSVTIKDGKAYHYEKTASEKLEILKNAIRKAVPEILELRLGCIIIDDKGWHRTITSSTVDQQIGDLGYFDIDRRWFWQYEIQEILGRDIGFDDITIWISKLLKNSDTFRFWVNQYGIISHSFEDGIIDWEPNVPLHKQSEELISFLYNLIDNHN